MDAVVQPHIGGPCSAPRQAPRSRRSEPRLQGNRDQSPGDAAPRGQDDGREEIRAPGTAGGNVHRAAEEDRLMGPEMETLNHHGMPPFHS